MEYYVNRKLYILVISPSYLREWNPFTHFVTLFTTSSNYGPQNIFLSSSTMAVDSFY